MIREKWFYIATGVLLSFLALVLVNIRITELTERVQKLERYVPYLEPAPK